VAIVAPWHGSNPHFDFFCHGLHGLLRIFTDGHLFFGFIFDLLNFSVLIRAAQCSSVAKIRIAVMPWGFDKMERNW
jgi:hypothetical protein